MTALRTCEWMNSKLICAPLCGMLILLGCERASMLQNQGVDESTQQEAENVIAPEEGVPSTNGLENVPAINEASAAPPALTLQAERGIEGARNVLLSFARAIEQKKFGQAWSLLIPGDQQKMSKEGFAANFAGLSKISVAIPTGTTDGAAGSIYYTAPVTITATDQDGRPIGFEGEAILRRINDVDGATPAQLRWHFDSLTLDWTH